MHCWRGCEYNCCCGWRPHLLLGWVVEKSDLILHIPAVCQLVKFCCILTVLPDDPRVWDACCVQGWKSKSGLKRALAGTLASGINDEARGWFTKPGCSHSRWAGRAELPPKQWARSLVITERSEQQIRRRCTAMHLATRYSLLSSAFTAQWNKTKAHQKSSGQPTL